MGLLKTITRVGLGAIVGGPAGAAAALYVDRRNAQRSAAEPVKRAVQEQTNAYENQMRSVQAESARMNENIMRQSQRVAAGVARQNRSRIRGGGFGDNAGQNAVGDRLG